VKGYGRYDEAVVSLSAGYGYAVKDLETNKKKRDDGIPSSRGAAF